MISVPIENDFSPQTGVNKEDSYVLQRKPVVPFSLSKNWNLITRTIIPIIQVPDLAPGVTDTDQRHTVEWLERWDFTTHYDRVRKIGRPIFWSYFGR